MQDFRLKVFAYAARSLSFSRCAEQMMISQPAVSKHISELETYFGKKLFFRKGTRLELTDAGQLLYKWTGIILPLYEKMDYEMSLLDRTERGHLRVGASTTVAQYVLPAILAKYHNMAPDVNVSLISGNSQSVENMLFAGEIDLGFVENLSRRSGLKYYPFLSDKLVLVVGRGSNIPANISVESLRNIPIVLRESGSGTLEMLQRRLDACGISLASLKIVAKLGSTEAIKSYVSFSDACAVISTAAIEDELACGDLRAVDVTGVDFSRQFMYVTCQGDKNPLVSRFVEFAKTNL